MLAQAYRHMWIAPGMDPLSFPGGPVPSQQTGAVQATRAHVPPVVAHMQKEYVKPHKIKSRRRCAWAAWAPFCEHTIDVCGGSNKCKCKDHHNMYNSNYTDKELKKAKQRMQNEEKAQRKAKRNKPPDENT
eukprot:scaffold194704_cov67-Attheya_sp.AAC.1